MEPFVSVIIPLYQYKNAGFFNVFGLFSIWTPITWTFVFALYLVLLPRRWGFLVPYVIAFIGLNVFIGTVLANLGLFAYYKPFYKYLDLFVFSFWFVYPE